VLPGTINVTKPHDKFEIEKSPFYVNSETRPWFKNGVPRRAGISAFGFGGVNVHFAMEEYGNKTSFTDRIHQTFHSIFIKAPNTKELISSIKSTHKALVSEEAIVAFHHLKETSKQGIAGRGEARLGFVAESLEACISKLEIAVKQLENNAEAWSHPKGIYFRPHAISSSAKIASLFSGQGSQYANMASEATSSFELIQKTIAAFDAKKEYNLANKIYPKPVFTPEDKAILEKNITNTEFAQPAIGSISLGYYNVFKNAGFKSDMVAGHSFGELTALCASGVISETDYMTLAIARGKAMGAKNTSGDAGAMLAVKAASEEIKPLISAVDDVSIANLNSSSQIVLGGNTESITKVKALLDTKKYRSVLLPVSAAFHTKCVEHAQKPFEKSIKAIKFSSPIIPVYSNTTGDLYPNDPGEIKKDIRTSYFKSGRF
jgi:acyl transferase domain-containing protein